MILISDNGSVIDNEIGAIIGCCEIHVLAAIDKWLTVYQGNREKYEGDHYKEGRWWTYNTVEALAKETRMFSKRQVQSALRNLKEQNIIIIGHFFGGYNRTNWYTIDYDNLLAIANKANPKFTEYKRNNNAPINSDNIEPMHSDKSVPINSTKTAPINSDKIVPINGYKTVPVIDTKSVLSYTTNNNIHNKTTNSTTISLIYINDPAEKEKVCEMFDRTIKNNLIANYPIHTNLTLVEIMIRNRVSECHSFDEAEQLLGALWHGVNLYKSEYESKHRDEDGNVDYQFLPNLKKVYTTELMDDETYYFQQGLKAHRQFMRDKYGKVYGGEANAG